MALQLRALGPPWSIRDKGGGKGCIEHLSLVPVPACEVTILSLEQASGIFALPTAIILFKISFYCPPQFWQPQLHVSFGFFHMNFLPPLAAISLCSSHATWPCSHCSHTFLYCLFSKRIFLFSQAILLPMLFKWRILDYLSSPNCGSRTTGSGF